MASLILHIGYPKTGTSWMQAFLHQNSAALRALGVDYLDAGLRQGEKAGGISNNHSFLVKELRSSVKTYGHWERLVTAVRTSDLPHCLISSEVFSELPEEWIRLASKLLDGVDVHVLVWIRPQAEAIASRYLEALKAGNRIPEFPDYLRNQLRGGLWHYRERLGLWGEVFGHDNLAVRVYDRSKFPDGDILQDLRLVLGIGVSDWAALVRPPEREANHGIGALSYMTLRRITATEGGYTRPIPDLRDPLAVWHSHAFKVLQTLFDDFGWNRRKLNLLTPEIMERCRTTYTDGNAYVARRYLGRDDGRLFDDAVELPMIDLSEIALKDEDWARIVAGLRQSLARDGMEAGICPVAERPGTETERVRLVGDLLREIEAGSARSASRTGCPQREAVR